MGHQTKWEYLRAIYERHRQAGHRVKHVILNEFCLNTATTGNTRFGFCTVRPQESSPLGGRGDVRCAMARKHCPF